MRITKACPVAGTEVYHFTIWVLDPLFLCFSSTLCLLNPLHLPPSDLFPSHLFPILKQKALSPLVAQILWIITKGRVLIDVPNTSPRPPGLSLALCLSSLTSCPYLLSSLYSRPSHSLSFLKDPHAAGLYRTPGNSVVGIVHSSLFSTSCIQHGTLGEMSFTTSLRFISLASHFKNLLEAELYLLVWCYSCCQTERSLRQGLQPLLPLTSVSPTQNLIHNR